MAPYHLRHVNHSINEATFCLLFVLSSKLGSVAETNIMHTVCSPGEQRTVIGSLGVFWCSSGDLVRYQFVAKGGHIIGG